MTPSLLRANARVLSSEATMFAWSTATHQLAGEAVERASDLSHLSHLSLARYVHLGCLRHWIRGRLNLSDRPLGSYFYRPEGGMPDMQEGEPKCRAVYSSFTFAIPF